MSRLLLLALALGSPTAGLRLQPFDELFADGVRAYYRSDWPAVVRLMEAAADSYRQQRRLQVRCRLDCAARHGLDVAPGTPPGDPLLAAALRRAHCIRQCEEPSLTPASVYRAAADTVVEFERRGPYNYLQLAYYKLNELQKAAAAAHTFFMANPEHTEMRQSLERYKHMDGVEQEHFIDLEQRPYMEAFNTGLGHYEKDQYAMAIRSFEEALRQFWQAEMECRAFCQGPQHFDGSRQPSRGLHLYEIIADHYLQVVQCEHGCVRELATRAGRLSPIHNYLPMHYDLLQYSYYKVSKYEKALEAAMSYLLFHPGDTAMLENQDYYRMMLQGVRDPDSISPSQDLIWYMERYELEKELLQSLSEELDFAYLDPINGTTPGQKNNDQDVVERLPGVEAGMHKVPEMPGVRRKRTERKAEQELHQGGQVPYDQVIVHDWRQLNGSGRVLLDNVITAQECRELYRVATSITIAGDGYRGKTSPHTPNERFEGATVYKALMYGVEGRIPLRGARLFHEASERARTIVQAYFLLNSTLYFSYTHLVCRTAIPGQQDNRNDLSHPIHADNCLLDVDAKECWKEPPAYTHRDYSAILYLNGDFDGGEFIFTEPDAKTVTAAVKPRCGRMVGFTSGGENPHGVTAVTRGQRCAVALWFTLNPHFRELERIKADEVLELISLQQQLGEDFPINRKDEL